MPYLVGYVVADVVLVRVLMSALPGCGHAAVHALVGSGPSPDSRAAQHSRAIDQNQYAREAGGSKGLAHSPEKPWGAPRARRSQDRHVASPPTSSQKTGDRCRFFKELPPRRRSPFQGSLGPTAGVHLR